jgi:hypothetical protein
MKAKLPASVQQFKSADECLDQKGLEAVLIASETSSHAELAKKAMDRGLVGCFCIKDLSISDCTVRLLIVACPPRETYFDRPGDREGRSQARRVETGFESNGGILEAMYVPPDG